MERFASTSRGRPLLKSSSGRGRLALSNNLAQTVLGRAWFDNVARRCRLGEPYSSSDLRVSGLGVADVVAAGMAESLGIEVGSRRAGRSVRN